jgi:hypothetical protein
MTTEQQRATEAAAAASPAATILAFLARPLSLLRHVARGLASRLKPAAASFASDSACRPHQEDAAVVTVSASNKLNTRLSTERRNLLYNL